ncbi:MAG: hypothetical protein ISS45_05225 [Candidatus Omnitrophica bacterium]|nr:hypothetical protein [Candidatus Omnitrophota bacterium]
MLNRQVVKEFLEENFEDIGIKIPEDISENVLVETFSKYIEDDYYEWLKDNFKSFTNYYNPDWNWIKEKINYYSKD